jgi:antitoxin (DNA-binding transcriptional repressor) of toxin-antitoxin stability system
VKTVEKSNLEACVTKAQSDRIVLTRDGAPVALLIGVAGLDREQIALGGSDEFWHLISQRRTQPTISRAVLEKRVQRRAARRRS